MCVLPHLKKLTLLSQDRQHGMGSCDSVILIPHGLNELQPYDTFGGTAPATNACILIFTGIPASVIVIGLRCLMGPVGVEIVTSPRPFG